MTRQSQVGAFAIVALLLLFGMFYIITDFGTRHTGYRIGVHFQSAAGLTSGALVYFSGVNVGSVESIALLPDNTVDVILAVKSEIDIPAASKFLIQAPLTGSPNVLIVPPVGQKPPIATLPKQVLPVDQQPQGSNSASIADLMEQGQGEIKRFDSLLAELEARTPKLLDTLQTTLNNANDLTVTTKATLNQLSGELLTMGGNFNRASANVVELSATLNSTATSSSTKLTKLLDQLDATSVSLNKSMNALESLATDPQMKANVLATTQSIADATATLAKLAQDLRTVTGDPVTQAQMRSTIANLDATLQRANSLLGEFGGTSNVYGVDAGATPPPVPAPGPTVRGGTPYPYSPVAAPTPGVNPTARPIPDATRQRAQAKLATLARNLIAFQVRLSGLSPQANPPVGLNPVLTKSQGPLGDINLILFPHSTTSFMVGANAIGNNTTWNALLQQQKGNLKVGGGVLYSQIGVLGQYQLAKGFGLETRIYDLTYPMIDLYGNIRILPGAELFFGQRDVNHASRRNTYGFQYQF